MTAHHLAQLNITRLLAPLSDPAMADFVAALPRVNALADAAPGFVWRLQDDAGDATALRPFGPDVLVNLSLWTSVEALREFAYRGPHLDPLRRRREWFTHEGLDPYAVLWWVPAGAVPTVDDAAERLDLLRRDGPGPRAFTMRQPYPAPESTDLAASTA